MNMKKMGKLVLSALSVLGLAACAVGSTDEEVLGESQEALINGTEFYGSDTLFNAITDTIIRCNCALDYLGTGSSKGEECLEGTGAAPCNTKAQTIAPMSRDLKGSCDSGQKSNRIALDAVALWANASAPVSNLSSAAVKNAYCGTCTAPWTGAKLYRRDDISGTTDTFRSLNSCSTTLPYSWCPGIEAVEENSTTGPRLQSDAAGTSSLTGVGLPPLTPPATWTCLVADSVTDCMGKIAAKDVNNLAYAGLDAATAGAQALSIDSVAPTPTTIRYLVNNGGTPYKYARFLYLNEGNGSRATAETNFLNWIIANPANFEDALTDAGFIACDPGNPLECGATGTTCPRNSSLP
ncbi:hypothetical protein [Sorangium sp. So ce124]|uniref:hypothetical protein n=1 Tax=Sorangium sp. So ce124 TaxID=3133280 RepID=UPI003F61C929